MKKKMMKKVVSFALAMVMVLTSVLIGGVDAKADETTEEITLQDADFDGSFWSDGIWSCTTSEWVGTTDVRDASRDSATVKEFEFWRDVAGDATVTQNLDSLEAGTYYVSVEATGNNVSVKMKIGDNLSDAIALSNGYSSWETLTGTITLTEDITSTVALGFVLSTEGNGGAQVDKIKLEKVTTASTETTKTFVATTKIVNGDFETNEEEGIEGWTVVTENTSMTCQDKTDGYANNNKTNMVNYSNNNSAAASFSMSQTITGLEAGTYKLALQQEGAAGTSGLSVKVSGTTVNVSKALPATTGWDAWATVETDEFTLASAEDVTISISGDVAAGYWGDFDNVVLYKADASGSTTNPEGGNTTNPEGGNTTNPEGGNTTTPDNGNTTTPEGENTAEPEEEKVDEKPVVIELDNSNFSTATDGTWTGEIAKGEWQDGNDMDVKPYSSDSYLELPSYVGTTGLKFNMEQGNTMTILQWVDSLKAGTYTITAPVMGENTDVYLVLGDKEIKATSLSGYNNWTKAKATFKITEDMTDVKVGFKLVATSSGDNSWSWGWIDSIQLIKTVPSTGDTTNAYAYVLLMMAGLAIVGYSVKRNKVQF